MKRHHYYFLPTLFILCLILTGCSQRLYDVSKKSYMNYPKREFRGAWMHTVGNSLYQQMTPNQMKTYLTRQLDVYQRCGINAIIFQVRPQADAFYRSTLEPWSRYFTGTQGKAPSPVWDPMAFLIEECHYRNMEFHAWLNPYRVTSSASEQLATNHVYRTYPQYFVKYGNQIYFQPGEPWSRRFIKSVVEDIVRRYDVDAIHMDDYFYPYPIAGEQFPDKDCFQTYREQQGFEADQLTDWRRDNVNLLIQNLSVAIHDMKPWVKFGISPFGIYRNKRQWSKGSDTNGLSNYDDLYADVQLWMREGWIDYVAPQIYWEIGHKAADYNTLVEWWAKNSFGVPLYVGQDISRTVTPHPQKPNRTQLSDKMNLMRKHGEIAGNVFWSGAMMQENLGNIQDSLKKNYHRYPAFVPVMPHLDDIPPTPVQKVSTFWDNDKLILFWVEKEAKSELNRQTYYAVYCFNVNEKVDLSKPNRIVAITRERFVELPYKLGKRRYRYVVTAFDRLHNESSGRGLKVKL